SDSDIPPWGFHLISDAEPQSPEDAPQSLEQAPPSPDYVPRPEYPEYLAPSDDEIPIEDQPLPADASPTALSPGYVADSDPLEEDPEEDSKESVFHISNCIIACQIKFATCTLLGSALTWRNSHVKIVGHDAAYGMTWKTLMKMITAKYCPRSEIRKLEFEIWNLKESNEVEKYVGGLPDMIQGSVMASKPKTMQDAIEFANDLMDQKIPKAYTARPGKKSEYGGSLPLYTKCNYHHNGQCAPKCNNCKKVGHLAHDYRSPAATANNQRAPGVIQRVVTCFKYGIHGHYKKDCPKLKNKNREIKLEMVKLKKGLMQWEMQGQTQTPISLVDIILSILDHDYDVELADKNIIEVNTIIRGYTLNFLNHPFNIDLLPVELGSFDIIIGMDWLAKYHAVIVWDEKIVRIPFGNEILMVHGDGSNNGHESRLNIISCTKTQKYLLKGCHVFLAHIIAKKAEDKLEEKRLKNVHIVRDFHKVFPEDLPGFPPTRQVEFLIDLIPGAAPVVRAPYQFAPSEIKNCQINYKSFPTKALYYPVPHLGELQFCLSRRRMGHSGCASITGN
ncbi:putative reverse transcriptase domain-containing protein, partial [Tanacetum coccineum]